MHRQLSPKQVAQALGVSESSLKRWCDRGVLASVKTEGGHRRIALYEVLRFVREKHHPVAAPQLLALPAADDRKARRLDECAERLTDGLLAGNDLACRTIIFDLFLAGHALSEIFDEVIAVAMRCIGDKWSQHETEIYEERTACQLVLTILHELRAQLPEPQPLRRALGATPAGDQYHIPSSMAEIVLRSAGWDARWLGANIPLSSLLQAVERHRPALVWLSVSHLEDAAEFVTQLNQFFAECKRVGAALVVGGRALTAEIRPRLHLTAGCDTMQNLEEIARMLSHAVALSSEKAAQTPLAP